MNKKQEEEYIQMADTIDTEDWMKTEEGNGEFEGEVWLSTDGKNTVRVLGSTKEGRAAGLLWAKEVYNRLLAVYGTKQDKVIEAAKKASPGLSCEVCGAQAIEKQGTGKNGKPYHAYFCSTENKSHTKWMK